MLYMVILMNENKSDEVITNTPSKFKFVVDFISRIKNIKQKILITAVYAAILMVLRYFKVDCISVSLLGLPCPGCGMTRAVVSALMLDLPSAFSHHAMFWAMPVLYLYFLFDGNLFKNKKVNKAVFVIIAVGFLLNWLVKLCRIW